MNISDPFPHPPPLDPIIPVEEEDIEDPDTGTVNACVESDPLRAQEMARQKLRSMTQKLDRKFSPAAGTPRVKPSGRPDER